MEYFAQHLLLEQDCISSMLCLIECMVLLMSLGRAASSHLEPLGHRVVARHRPTRHRSLWDKVVVSAQLLADTSITISSVTLYPGLFFFPKYKNTTWWEETSLIHTNN